jgi:hypothetical protein
MRSGLLAPGFGFRLRLPTLRLAQAQAQFLRPGSRHPKAMNTGTYWRGLIRRTRSGNAVYIHAQLATAEFFGWTEAFDPLRPAVQLPPRPDGRCLMGVRYGQPWVGGHRMRICRSSVRSGQPRKLTHRFRVGKSATLVDLAALAAATKGEWFWMTDFRGARLARADWLALPATHPFAA